MATVVFIGLFLILPSLVLVWMTIERRRNKARAVRGFEVKLTAGGEPVMKKKEDDRG